MTPLTAEEKARLRQYASNVGMSSEAQVKALKLLPKLLDAYEALEKELRHEKRRWPADEKPIVLITQGDEDDYFIARDLTRPGLLIHADHEAGALGKLLEIRTDYDQLATEAGLIREGD